MSGRQALTSVSSTLGGLTAEATCEAAIPPRLEPVTVRHAMGGKCLCAEGGELIPCRRPHHLRVPVSNVGGRSFWKGSRLVGDYVSLG